MNAAALERTLVRWPALSAVGLAIGAAAGLPLGMPVELALGMGLVIPVVGSVIGGSFGLAQWIAGAREIVDPLKWVAGTAVGMGIGLTAGTALVESIGLGRGRVLQELLAVMLIGGVAGAAVGAAQWVWLRRRTTGAGSWIVLSGVGLAAGFLLGGLTAELLLGTFRSPGGMALIAVAGGAVSGLVLQARWRTMITAAEGPA